MTDTATLTLPPEWDPQLEIRTAASGGDGRTVTMLVVPYGRVALVGGTGGVTRERLMRGVFARSIQQRGDRIPFISGHWNDDDVTNDPARIMAAGAEWQDSAEGLRASTRVVKSPAGDHLLAQIAEGIIGGVSVGYSPDPQRSKRMTDNLKPEGWDRFSARLLHVAYVESGAWSQAVVEKVASNACSDIRPRLVALEAALAVLRSRYPS